MSSLTVTGAFNTAFAWQCIQEKTKESQMKLTAALTCLTYAGDLNAVNEGLWSAKSA